MHTKKQGPSWCLLYLSLPLMIGLLLLEMRLPMTDTGHRFAEFIIVLIVFGSMSLWLKANAGALIQEDLENWHSAMRMDTSPVSAQAVEIKGKNGKMDRRPRRVWGSGFRRLIGWASVISGFFH